MSYLLATNSFHKTSVPAAIIDSCITTDIDTGEDLELVQVDFNSNKLCGMVDCRCHIVDQKVFMYDYDGIWYLKSSFDTTDKLDITLVDPRMFIY